MKVVGKLTEKQYFAWKNKLLEMEVADRTSKMTDLQYSLMERDIEVARYKSLLFKENIRIRQAELTDSKAAYQEFKNELAKEVDFPLEHVIIDEVTFEVKVEE